MSELTRMTKAQALTVFQEAVDVADRLIERAYGDGVLDEWNEAFAVCAEAMQRLPRPAGRLALKEASHG